MSAADYIGIIDVTTRDERQVQLDISGGPVQAKPYGSRRYRVTVVIITYRRRNGEPWAPASVDLRGPFVKKDGSDGADSTRESLWIHREWPDWVLELVDRYAPDGAS